MCISALWNVESWHLLLYNLYVQEVIQITYNVVHACVLLEQRGTGIDGMPSCIGDASVAGIFDDLGVLVERALGNLERRRLPLLAAALELLGSNLQLNSVLDCIHRDNVAVADQSDGPADLRFRHDVANAETVAPAPPKLAPTESHTVLLQRTLH